MPLLVDEEKTLPPPLSPLVLGDACGNLSGAAGSTLEGDQGFPVSTCSRKSSDNLLCCTCKPGTHRGTLQFCPGRPQPEGDPALQ